VLPGTAVVRIIPDGVVAVGKLPVIAVFSLEELPLAESVNEIYRFSK
jgi:hypothetical protein